MKGPDVSILLLSWNTRELTLACLEALPASADDVVSYEVIVVDNGSQDGSAEALAERSDIRLIANSRNRGYAAGVNQAYAYAEGELVLLLNSDLRLAPGALATLVRFLRQNPEAAGVAPLYVNPDGSRQAHYYRLPTFGVALALATNLRRLPPFARRLRAYRMVDEDLSRPRVVSQPSASCLLLRRSRLPIGQLLDESYPIFFNDVLLARSLAARGEELWVAPDAVAVHELGASTGLLGHSLARQHLGSLARYVAATEPPPRVLLFRALVFIEWLARRFLRRAQALSIADLRRALGGDPGPPPQAAGDSTAWVLYMSAIPWAWNRNRQQELALQIARGRRVLFIEPPGLLPAFRLRVQRLLPSLWRARQPALLPLSRFLPLANRLNRRFAAWQLRAWLARHPGQRLLWIDEDLAAPSVGRLGEVARVYDATDLDWTFTRRWNRRHLRRALGQAVSAADLVLTSSRALTESLALDGKRPIELLNACDPGHFQPDGPVAARLADLPRPRVGYVGAIDERAFDGPLVAAVARLRPRWSFVLVGPVRPAADRDLRGLANVHLLGPVAYEELPALVRGFDVCLIPYRTDGLASYAHPKKFFEYLATGKPVVATPLSALTDLDAPYFAAATPEEFVAAVEAALLEGDSPELMARRRACANANSWQARGAELRELLASLERRAA